MCDVGKILKEVVFEPVTVPAEVPPAEPVPAPDRQVEPANEA